MKNKFFTNLILILFGLILSTPLINSSREVINPVLNIEISSDKDIGILEFYINNLQDKPKLLLIKSKSKSEYELKLNDNVNFIRIDFGDFKDNYIKIYKLEFKLNNQTKEISLQELKKWNFNNLILISEDNNYLEYKSTGNDPFIYNHIDIKFNNYKPEKISGFIAKILTIDEARILYLYLISVLIFICLTFSNLKAGIYSKIKFALISIIPILIFYYFPNFNLFGNFLSSIGRASYNNGFFIANINLRIFISLALTSILILTLKNRLTFVNTDLYENKKGNFFTIFILLAIVFLFFIIDLNFEKNLILSTRLSNDWDGSNINYWSYLVGKGEIPYKDFWYPYGGFFFMDLNFPYGSVISCLYKIITYSIFSYLIFNVISSNIYINLILIITIIIGREVNLFWGLDRYILSIIILLSFIYFYKSVMYKNRLSISVIIFNISFTLSLIFDLPQILYVSPGILAIILYDYFIVKNKNLVKYIISKLLTPIILIIFIFIIVLYYFDVFYSFIYYYKSLGDMSQGSQVFLNYKDLFNNLSFTSFFIFITFLIFVILNIRIIYKYRDLTLTYITMGFFSISLFVLQKHIIRPMDWQFLIIPFMFFVIYIVYTSDIIKSKLMFFIYGVCISILFANAALLGSSERYFTHITGGFSRIVNSIKFLLDDFKTINKINNGSFNIDSDEYAVAKYVKLHSEKNSDLYVINDSSNIYIYYQGLHPFHSNSYNMSPLGDQLINLNWLIDSKPKYAVLDRTKLNFDLVPNNIRNPLIYNYIVNNYSYLLSIGRFDILLLNSSNTNTDYVYWTKLLGDSIDLKYIPMYSNPYSCSNKKSDSNVADIRLLNPSNFDGDVILRFHYKSGRDFYVKFHPSTEKSNYWINLNRLWFYNESLIDYIRPESSNIAITIFPCAVSNSRLY
jgi:hypothetical protein